MIRLHQSFGAHAGRRFELDQERIRFGRLPDNEVAFDPHADLDASGRHAEIVRQGGEYVLYDVGSRNGTFVDGERVDRAVLAGGEEIEFGSGGPRIRVELPSRGGARVGAADEVAGELGPDPELDAQSIEPTRIRRAPAPRGDRLLHVSVAVLIFGILVAVTAIAVLLGPKD